MVVGKMKTSRNTNEDPQKTKFIRLLKVFTLKRKFQKNMSSSEIDTIVGLKYKQRKGWSFSDLFNLKQRSKVEEEGKATKDDSYVGPDDILPLNIANNKFELSLVPSKKITFRKEVKREEIIKNMKQKSLNAVILEAKMELRNASPLIMDCNYVPIESIDVINDKRKAMLWQNHESIECAPFTALDSDYVDMAGSG